MNPSLNKNSPSYTVKPRVKDWNILIPNSIKEYFDDKSIMISFMTSRIKELINCVRKEINETSSIQGDIVINIFINIFNLNTSNIDNIIKECKLSKNIKEEIEELKTIITEGKNEEFESHIQRLGFDNKSNIQNSFVHEMIKKQSTIVARTALRVAFGTQYSEQEYELNNSNYHKLSRSMSEGDVLAR